MPVSSRLSTTDRKPFRICVTAFFTLSLLLCVSTSIADAQCVNLKLPFDNQFPDSFPDITELSFLELSGRLYPGEEFLGQAVVVVMLLPGCPKCTGKLPALEQIRKSFEREGTVFIVMSKTTSDSIRTVQRTYGYEKWLWIENGPSLSTKLRNKKSFEVLLFDPLGRPCYRFYSIDKDWSIHLELGLGAVLNRALDLSSMPGDFVSSMVCGMCHAPEWLQWSKTPHAHAYETLCKEGKQRDRKCISCHVTGLAGRTDVRNFNVSDWRKEVGCEECHGPGGPHRTVRYRYHDLYSTDEKSCLRCHDEKNSPDWDYDVYLPKVMHHSSPQDKDSSADLLERVAEEDHESGDYEEDMDQVEEPSAEDSED